MSVIESKIFNLDEKNVLLHCYLRMIMDQTNSLKVIVYPLRWSLKCSSTVIKFKKGYDIHIFEEIMSF